MLNFIAEHITDQIFLAFWLLGIPYVGVVFFPESVMTRRLVFLWSFICGVLYLVLTVYRQPNLFYMVYHSYSTAEGFKEIAQDAFLDFAIYLQIIGWDLLIGYWLSLDAKRIGVPHSIRIPFLCVYMHFPPSSFAIYLIARFIKTKQLPPIFGIRQAAHASQSHHK